MANDPDDEIDLDAIEDPVKRRFLKSFDELPEAMKDRFLRLAERIAALPRDVQANITNEQMVYMLENDVDYPFN